MTLSLFGGAAGRAAPPRLAHEDTPTPKDSPAHEVAPRRLSALHPPRRAEPRAAEREEAPRDDEPPEAQRIDRSERPAS